MLKYYNAINLLNKRKDLSKLMILSMCDKHNIFNVNLNKYDVNDVSNTGNTALHYAVKYNNMKYVKLLSSKSNCNILNVYYETPLMLAIKHRNNEMIKILNEYSCCSVTNYYNITAYGLADDEMKKLISKPYKCVMCEFKYY